MTLANAADGLCVNVGCGLSAGEHWLNVDSSYSLLVSRIPGIGNILAKRFAFPDWPSSVVYGDIVKGLDISTGTCKLVFASHVLEHVAKGDCERALRNIYTYLRPGGYFRCIIPDLEWYAREYVTHLDSPDAEVTAGASHHFMIEANVGSPISRRGVSARLREAFSNSRHQWMWDRTSFTAALFAVGFRSIKQRAYEEWADGLFAEVEDKGRHANSFCLEAGK